MNIYIHTRYDNLLNIEYTVREWARLGARSEAEARAFFLQSYRRRLGVCVVREFARHRLRRVHMVGVARGHLQAPRPVRPSPHHPSPMEFFTYQAFAPHLGVA